MGLSLPEEHVSLTIERNVMVAQSERMVCSLKAEDVRPFVSDLNLFWCVGGKDILCGTGKRNPEGALKFDQSYSIEEWKLLGYDLHSVVADPLLLELDGPGYALADGSPAFAVGFLPIDLSELGPRTTQKHPH